MSLRDLEQAIESTRQDLDQTLSALQSRLSPTRRLKAAWGATRAGSAGALRGGVTWAVSHPGLVLMMSAALVLALRALPEPRRR